MDRAFKTRCFERWARDTGLTDAALRKTVSEMSAGLIDADLGAGVVKKRVALLGRGKSGGVRTIVATKLDGRWFFMYGYEKNVMDSIGAKALRALQGEAADLLTLDADGLVLAVQAGEIQEIAL